jgi:hypothetical protein
MSSTRFSSWALALCALAVPAVQAQDALVTLQAASSKVLVNGSAQASAAVTNQNGSPLDASGLAWSSSDEKIATVSNSGLIAGLAPGDAVIRVKDARSGADVSKVFHIVPASMSIQVTPPTFAVGETASIAVSALDAAGKAIPGLRFQYRSGQTSVATVTADGSVTGVSAGTVTLQASILGVARNPSLVITTPVHILAKPKYKLRKLISTDTLSTTTIAAVSSLSAVNTSATGAIVTLGNGGQAAILMEGSKTTVLAAAGQTLPATGRMVLRIDGISVNSKGDAALVIEYPNQWCMASVILFPHGQPEVELGAAGCYNALGPHSLADDGTVVYRNNDQIWSASATSEPRLLFSLATQPTLRDPIRSVNNFVAGGGAFIVGGTLNSGATGYFWSDGKSFTQVYRSGDSIRNTASTSMDTPIASATGQFYARVNIPSSEALVQLGSTGLQTLLAVRDTVPGGTLGWIHSLTDASSAGVLFGGDFSIPSNYHSAAAVWTVSGTAEAAPLAGWSGIIAGALPSNGVPLVYALLGNEPGIAGLRTLSSGEAPKMILASESNFPQPAPAGIDWHYASRAGSPSVLPVRAAGEAIVAVDGSVQPIAAIGSPLSNGKMATWIGGAMSNTSGDIVFTAGYSTGSGLFRYRGGRLETLLDSAVPGPNALASPSWFYSHRGRYLALNNRGDAAYVGTVNNGFITQVSLFAGGVLKPIAGTNTNSPNGPVFNSFNQVALDENDRVLFTATTADGKFAAYFWDGNTVQRVIGVGDKTPSGTVNDLSNINGGAQGFLIMLAFDNYRLRELRYFDGQSRTLESSDTSLLAGAWLNYFWMNEATLGGNRDAHYQVQTDDGGVGVYARRADGSLAVVARSRDPLPGGEWMLFPLTVSSGAGGEVYFTAYTWNNGVEALALYLATPQ